MEEIPKNYGRNPNKFKQKFAPAILGRTGRGKAKFARNYSLKTLSGGNPKKYGRNPNKIWKKSKQNMGKIQTEAQWKTGMGGSQRY